VSTFVARLLEEKNLLLMWLVICEKCTFHKFYQKEVDLLLHGRRENSIINFDLQDDGLLKGSKVVLILFRQT